MRLSVTVLRDVAAERRAREKAEAPTVKTEAQAKADAAARAKGVPNPRYQSPWKRTFKPLSEEKAVDLFADVLGDAFVLGVAIALVIFEASRSKKPDSNAGRIEELDADVKEKDKRLAELEELDRQKEERLEALEQALKIKMTEAKLKLVDQQQPATRADSENLDVNKGTLTDLPKEELKEK